MNNKKIAIFTHFNVCNFGANLQALSTNLYFKQHGFEPIFINWTGYQKKIFSNIPKCQQEAHDRFIHKYFIVSPSFNTSEEIYRFLVENNIFNVILGSDAVFSLDTWYDRISINRYGIHINDSSDDKKFPNPYWFTYLIDDKRFKIAAMSVSSQNCFYHILPRTTKKMIKACINRYDFITARDSWTQKMIYNLSGRRVNVTPDPVWGLNMNIQPIFKDSFPTNWNRLNISKPYILLGFQKAFKKETNEWLNIFIKEAHNNGYQCVPLPFAFGYIENKNYDTNISFPLDPLDWYRLIQNSAGYVGYNMHPIIAALHNNIPCYSIDNYGVIIMKYFNIESSSKIYDIMQQLNILKHRYSMRKFFKSNKISPSDVLDIIKGYDKQQGSFIVKKQYEAYSKMMSNIINIFDYEK